jgi:hypothetical protein
MAYLGFGANIPSNLDDLTSEEGPLIASAI